MARKNVGILIILLVFISCSSQDKNEHYQSILKIEEGHFRGVNIGMTLKQVRSIEVDSFLVDKMDDYLYYEYDISIGNSYTVSYDFSPKNTLYEIEVTTYLDEVIHADLLFDEFHQYFSSIYNNSKIAKDGYITWKIQNKNAEKNIEIAMINQSETYGIIIIKIRDLDN